MVKALADTFHPLRVILFGSRARGDARPDSDYDFLVIAETPLAPIERMFVARKALWGLRVSADVFVLTPGEAELLSQRVGSVAAAASTEGRVLYEAA
ncbi:MAG: nucleotidyltransferase domain-containing protein [Deltaproteobacteria bacterium]|nr:nucleotidyltransferase domain-containing protein [Deltaproteobacteria bacterium]